MVVVRNFYDESSAIRSNAWDRRSDVVSIFTQADLDWLARLFIVDKEHISLAQGLGVEAGNGDPYLEPDRICDLCQLGVSARELPGFFCCG
jgi:hypothetical protein